MTIRPDPTFHASPKLAMEAPPENFAYTLTLSPDFSKPDALAVIDVRPGSPTKIRLPHEVRHRQSLRRSRRRRRKLVEIANAIEAVQDGRIHVELINAPFLDAGGGPAEYRAGGQVRASQNYYVRVGRSAHQRSFQSLLALRFASARQWPRAVRKDH